MSNRNKITATPTRQQRLDLYLGARTSDPLNIKINDSISTFLVTADMDFDIFWRSMRAYPSGKEKLKNWSILTLEARYNSYIKPIADMMRAKKIQKNALVMAFDNRSDFEVPTFCKSLPISDEKKMRFIMPLDYKRHWHEVGLVDAADIPFQEKIEKIVWRGATTGSFKRKNNHMSNQRLAIAERFAELKNHDIGFSSIVENIIKESSFSTPQISSMMKPPLTLSAQLRYKYLLSLEGNDVASGLKWMLYSKSAVIMPKPSCETWACESLLRPFEHYIPVQNDLSDLSEIFEWCLKNDNEVEEIAKNGRYFISSFLNPEEERSIALEVFEEYFKHNITADEELSRKIKRWACR